MENNVAKCAGCNKVIQGSYLNALGKTWHKECFRCKSCGKTINGGFLSKNNHPYHKSCYQAKFSPKCHGCKKAIQGNYLTALGKKWHPEHFVCQACGKSLQGKKFFVKNDQPYCEKDYHRKFSQSCSVCSKPITQQYIQNYWGDIYCAEHEKKIPHCFSCGRVVSKKLTGGCIRYPDGHRICKLCHPTVISESTKGQPILEKVQRSLKTMGLEVKANKIPLRLVSLATLKKRSRNSNTNQPTGLIETEVERIASRETKRKILGILAVKGVPEEQLAMILAHELGHGFLFSNRYPTLSPVVEEGFAELCAYLWLSKQKNAKAKYRIKMMQENPNSIYGKGFRIAHQAWKKHSLAKILATIRKDKCFPK